MSIEKINTEQKLSLIHDYWNPRIAGELNGQQVKLVKFKGPFIWHKHEEEDELFYVLKGEFTMEFRDKSIVVKANEFLIVPRGTEHKPVAHDEVSVMLFEPASTLNTGNAKNELTKENPERI
ncbi:MAG TPA: cupin domain-containing protein [Chitinophagaceae bacterium]|nr:cupin domain-containing protein [Chitinophagaceae bacterium]